MTLKQRRERKSVDCSPCDALLHCQSSGLTSAHTTTVKSRSELALDKYSPQEHGLDQKHSTTRTLEATDPATGRRSRYRCGPTQSAKSAHACMCIATQSECAKVQQFRSHTHIVYAMKESANDNLEQGEKHKSGGNTTLSGSADATERNGLRMPKDSARCIVRRADATNKVRGRAPHWNTLANTGILLTGGAGHAGPCRNISSSWRPRITVRRSPHRLACPA